MENETEEIRSYSFFGLLWYALPSIISMTVSAIYACVDGYFIGTYVDEQAVSAVELFLPVENLFFAFAFMFGNGGNAELERLYGSKQKELADRIFSDLFWIMMLCGLGITALLVLLKNPLLVLLGGGAGAGQMGVWLDQYYSICVLQPFFYISGIALSVLMGGEGLVLRASIFSSVGGLVNIILDYIFLNNLHMGVPGAALATVIGNICTFLLFFIHYMPVWKDRRCFRFRLISNFASIGRICLNGISEMISTLALSVTVLLMNRLMVKAGGEDGVSALLVISYATEFFLAVFNGFNVVVEPLLSYQYGRKDSREIRKLYTYSFTWTVLIAVIGVLGLWLFRKPYLDIFFEKGSSMYYIGIWALVLSLPGIALQGINVYVQSFFTAFSDAVVSGILSALNTFVFMVAAELIMAYLFGENGLFAAQSVAETVTLFFSVFFMIHLRNKYGYGRLGKINC